MCIEIVHVCRVHFRNWLWVLWEFSVSDLSFSVSGFGVHCECSCIPFPFWKLALGFVAVGDLSVLLLDLSIFLSGFDVHCVRLQVFSGGNLQNELSNCRYSITMYI